MVGRGTAAGLVYTRLPLDAGVDITLNDFDIDYYPGTQHFDLTAPSTGTGGGSGGTGGGGGSGGGESPTDAVWSDWPLILTVVAWAAVCVWRLKSVAG